MPNRRDASAQTCLPVPNFRASGPPSAWPPWWKRRPRRLRRRTRFQYALTGGIISRSPANLQRVRNEFQVGNLYINCGITGAMVGRQPFGGFKMSGIGSQAGGPDYLLQFVVPRTITENTMRRGFAPPAAKTELRGE